MKEFIWSVIASFIISMLIAGILKIIPKFIKIIQIKKFEMKKIDNVQSSDVEGFDDLLINVIKNSISQELSFFASIRTRAAIFMGIAGIIINLFITVVYKSIIEIITNLTSSVIQHPNLLLLYLPTLAVGIVSLSVLAVSILMGFLILRHKKKINFLNPFEINNELANLSLTESKNIIKKRLIEDWESLKSDNQESEYELTMALKLLVIGIGCLTIFYLLTSPITIKIFS